MQREGGTLVMLGGEPTQRTFTVWCNRAAVTHHRQLLLLRMFPSLHGPFALPWPAR